MTAVTQAAPAEYQARHARWSEEHAVLSRQDRTIALVRLALFGLGVLLLVLAARAMTSPWWLLAPVLLFVPLLQRHERIIRARDNAARLVTFYERGLARLSGTGGVIAVALSELVVGQVTSINEIQGKKANVEA